MNKTIAILLILIFLSYTIGFSVGFGSAINKCITIGSNFLNITVNKDMVFKAVNSYQSHINYCRENALIRNDTRD